MPRPRLRCGVGVTALIGAGLIVVAAVIAALTLGGRAKARTSSR
jgi:hypothetical protein